MQQKVSVIGIGRLGLSFALLLDSKGYDVCGCDINEVYIQSLNQKTFRSDEPGINELLDNCNINFTSSSLEAFNHSSFIFIFVPTPSKETGEYDHQYIEQVIKELENESISFRTIIISCTVMPGYCSALKKRLSNLRSDVIYSPEFIQQGNIIEGLKNADIVLIGGKIPFIIRELYINIMERTPNFRYLSLTGAEIAKISINCFIAVKISFANMVGDIALNSGENNVNDILETIGSDSRIGNKFLGYGFPYGGPCIPRDGKALNCHANLVNTNTELPTDIDKENKRHSEYLKEYWIKQNPNKNVPFLFSYLGYKKGVNILTESYQFKLCMELLREGYKVIVMQDTSKMDMPKEFLEFYDNGMVLFDITKDAAHVN